MTEKQHTGGRPDESAAKKTESLKGMLRAYLALYIVFALIAVLIGVLSGPA